MKANRELLIGIIVAFVVSLCLPLFFASPIIKGKELKQFDITQFKGSAKEISDYREQGRQILWTNSMFSGMPAYVVSTRYTGNLFTSIRAGIMNAIPQPVPMLLLLMLNFFILLIAMKNDPWISIGGAVAFAFSTYFIVILAAGHNAKVDAMIWLPGIFAGMYVAYRRHILGGAALFGFMMAMELKASHPQMLYYFMFLAVAYVLTEGIAMLIKGKGLNFVKASAALLLMGLLALGSSYSYLKTTSDYAEQSIRGKSELTSNAENKTAGLDRDYLTQWSNGIGETWSLLVANYKGGESGDISKNPTAKNALKGNERQMLQGNSYWGDQPFSGGPVYVGAGVFLLFLLSFFFVKDYLKWPLLAASAFLILISWGNNVPGFTNFMIDYFPAYSKFRSVASALVIPELVIPLLAFLCAGVIASDKEFFTKKTTVLGNELPFTNQATFFVISGALLFITLLMYIAPGMFNTFFATGEYEENIKMLQGMGASQQQADEYMGVLETARIAIFKADVLRSMLFIILTGAAIWACVRFKAGKYVLAAALFFITAFDLVSIDGRYLNNDNFVAKNQGITKSPADDAILQDKDINYRVANLSVSIFQDATTSYYHKSIGGYHGAKLKKYQELIENSISPELEKLYGSFKDNPTEQKVMAAMQGLGVLNMLNTRYFILDPSSAPLRNPYALGNAWFPSEIKWVKNADEEIAMLNQINTATTAVADNKFKEAIGGVNLSADSISTIKQTAYDPEIMEYESNAATDKIAVFSEIWYPEGWTASVDGKEVPIGRVNYALRAIKVPAGKHKIEFSFAPRFSADENISFAFSALLLLLCLGIAGWIAYSYFKNDNNVSVKPKA